MPQPCTRPLMLVAIMLMIVVAARAQNAADASLRFVENRGQIVDGARHQRPDVLFNAQSAAGTLYLRTTGLSYVFTRLERDPVGDAPGGRALYRVVRDTSQRVTTYRMDMELVDANADARVEGMEAGADYTNYYLAHCPQGITGVRGFGRVIYHDIYPHIDLVYYTSAGTLKYDFVVHPGGRVDDIALRYTGSRRLAVTGDGRVVVESPLGSIAEGRPLVYTERPGTATQQQVGARYRVEDSTITFAVGAYDARRDLVIDPTVSWSTYFGGSGTDRCYFAINGIGGGTLDMEHAGSACQSGPDSLLTICGYATSFDFPVTPGVAQTVHAGNAGSTDCFVARLSQRGARLWATYIGGSNDERAGSITVDDRANVVLVARTVSADYPISPGAFQTTYSGSPGAGTITRFDAGGRRVWSTYFNGVVFSSAAFLSSGDVVVCGQASSVVQATPGAFQTAPPPAGTATGMLARFNAAGARVWCTFLGGTQTDVNLCDGVTDVAIGAGDTIAACGVVFTTDFPTTAGAYQRTLAGFGDAFIARFDADGRLAWSTLYGGSGNDFALGIAVDRQGDEIVSGYTDSPDFSVTAGAFQSIRSGSSDGFVMRFSAGGARRWATMLGGAGPDFSGAISIDRSGALWIGTTSANASDLSTPDAFQRASGGSLDAGVVKLDSAGGMKYASYLGGSNVEYLSGITATPHGCAVYGWTSSNDFPTTANAFQRTPPGGTSPFLTVLCDAHPTLNMQGTVRLCQGDSETLTASDGFDTYLWSTGESTRSIVVKRTGIYAVTASYMGCSGASDSVRVTVSALPTRRVHVSGPTRLCEGDSVTLFVDGGLAQYRWSSGPTSPSISVGRTGLYSVVFTDSNGCTNRSDSVAVTVLPRPEPMISASGPLMFCQGGSVVLTVTQRFAKYQWNTGDTTRSITVTKAGTYSVNVMSDSGCWSLRPATIIVKVPPPPVVAIRNLLPTSFCEGDSTILVSSPSAFASYLWSTGAVTPSITVKKDGIYTLTVTDTNGCTGDTSATITVKPRPLARIGANGPTRFCRGDSVILSVNAFAQTQWSNGAASQSIVVKESGKYFVTVMSDGGCYGTSDTAIVEVLSRPGASISGPVRVCPNTLASYSAPAMPNAAYTWSLAGGGTITSGAGTNTVMVQWDAAGSAALRMHVRNDSTGCSADTAITVVIGSSLEPLVTADRSLRLCSGDSVTLDAGAYAKYQWSTGAATRTIRVGAPGTYTVSVVDAKGCRGSSGPVAVTLNVPPAPVIDVPNGGFFCAGDSIVLDAGPGYATYLWTNGYSSRRIVLRGTGDVSVRVGDTNGCFGVSSVAHVSAIPLPTPSVSGPRQVCRNSTISYTTTATGGSIYQWNVIGGTLLNGQGTAGIRVQWGATGNGRVEVVETTAAGCSGTSPGHDVSIGDRLVPAVTPAGPLALCPGSTAHLDAGAGYARYQWSTGEQTQAIDVNSAGTYAVTVADSGGCTGTSDPVEVFAKAAPIPTITAGGPVEFCEGDSVLLAAEPGYVRYVWSTGASTPSIIASRSGSYTVIVTDVDGCTGASKPLDVIVHPLPPVPVINLTGDRLTSTPAATYQWLRDGVPIPGARAGQLQATTGGAYQVVIADSFGCTATSAPLRYRSIAAPRSVMLDTVAARVGHRAHLVMHVRPALQAGDSVRSFHAELRYDPHALFIHDVISPDRTATGEPAMHHADATGLLTIDRALASPVLSGDELFRIEFEGLVSGQPLDVMAIEKMTVPEIAALDAAGGGLVILSGCEIGTAFAKAARIEAITPNPARDEMVLRYRLPVGREGIVRLTDAAGREVLNTTTPAGTGNDEELRVNLAQVASGIYMVELRDGGERSGMAVVITR